jgi:hypothetical protein
LEACRDSREVGEIEDTSKGALTTHPGDEDLLKLSSYCVEKDGGENVWWYSHKVCLNSVCKL